MNCFVVLAYNEEENLPRLFVAIKEAATLLGDPYQIILVNDGSRDGTVRVADSYKDKMPIHIEHHSTNHGVGQGFQTGFRIALERTNDDDIIFTLEADNTSDLSLLPEMKRKILEGADLVMGSCYAPGGDIRGVSFARETMSRSVNHAMRLVFPIKNGHTYSSFYRAYRAGIIRKADKTFGEGFIVSRGFACAAEILLKLRRLGAVMDEIPMILQFDERIGKSKMRVWKTIFQYVAFFGREIRLEIQHKFARAR